MEGEALRSSWGAREGGVNTNDCNKPESVKKSHGMSLDPISMAP